MMLVDRYGYAVGDRVLGDAGSPLRFDQPWVGVPDADLGEGELLRRPER